MHGIVSVIGVIEKLIKKYFIDYITTDGHLKYRYRDRATSRESQRTIVALQCIQYLLGSNDKI